MSCIGVDRSRTITSFVLLNKTYVLGNVRSELFLCLWLSVVHVFVLFYFSQQTFILLLFYPISKKDFHLGGLVSKMHISVYMLFTERKCFCFFSFIEYNLGIMNIQCILNILSLNVNGLNSAVKRTRVLEYLHRKSISCALIQETHLKHLTWHVSRIKY